MMLLDSGWEKETRGGEAEETSRRSRAGACQEDAWHFRLANLRGESHKLRCCQFTDDASLINDPSQPLRCSKGQHPHYLSTCSSSSVLKL
jgi:hypothetical protein